MKSTDFRLDLGIWYAAEMLAGKDVPVRVFLGSGIVIEGKILSVVKGNQGAGTVRMIARPLSTGYGASDRSAPDEITIFDQRTVQMITFLGLSE